MPPYCEVKKTEVAIRRRKQSHIVVISDVQTGAMDLKDIYFQHKQVQDIYQATGIYGVI